MCQVPWQSPIFDNVEVELVPRRQSSQSRSWESCQRARKQSSKDSVDQPEDKYTKGECQHAGNCETKKQLVCNAIACGASDRTVIYISPCAREKLSEPTALVISASAVFLRLYHRHMEETAQSNRASATVVQKMLGGMQKRETLAPHAHIMRVLRAHKTFDGR